MVTALKQMGFDYVFDTNFTADLTIMEEGSEFVDRFTHREAVHVAHVHLLLSRLGAVPEGPVPGLYRQSLHCQESPSRCSALWPKDFAEKIGVDPKRIFCGVHHALHRKKSEAALPTMRTISDDPDVDVVLTTREIVRMFRGEQINPATMEETPSTVRWVPVPVRR